MTITQMLDTLDAAISDAEANPSSRLPWRRRRALIVRLTASRVLGERGVPDGVDEQGRLVYGYSVVQCRRMRATILAAAQEDYHLMTETPES
jgi:hypothetical protein